MRFVGTEYTGDCSVRRIEGAREFFHLLNVVFEGGRFSWPIVSWMILQQRNMQSSMLMIWSVLYIGALHGNQFCNRFVCVFEKGRRYSVDWDLMKRNSRSTSSSNTSARIHAKHFGCRHENRRTRNASNLKHIRAPDTGRRFGWPGQGRYTCNLIRHRVIYGVEQFAPERKARGGGRLALNV